MPTKAEIVKYKSKYPIHSAIRARNQALAIDMIQRTVAARFSLEVTESYDDCVNGVLNFEDGYTPISDQTPLQLAADYKLTKVVSALIDANAYIEASAVDSGETALHKAAQNNCKSAVGMLISAGANLDAREFNNGNTALMFAAENGNNSIIKQLISAGAKTDILDHRGCTLFEAAAFKNQLSTLKLLYSINRPTISSLSLSLNGISDYINIEASKWLIENGANGDQINSWISGTVLHSACCFREGTSSKAISYIEFLTQAFSDDWLYSQLKLKNRDGKTPIEVAKHHDVAIYLTTFISEYETKQALSKHKAEIPDVTPKTKSKTLDIL